MQNITFCSYNEDLLPYKATEGSIGRDLKLAEDITVPQGEVVLAPTGVKTALPIGRGIKIYARSSLPVKMGLMVANSVAIIDADYRGELKVELLSFSGTVELKAGTRIAQLEVFPYFVDGSRFPMTETPKLNLISDENIYENFDILYPSERGVGGFGSTT